MNSQTRAIRSPARSCSIAVLLASICLLGPAGCDSGGSQSDYQPSTHTGSWAQTLAGVITNPPSPSGTGPWTNGLWRQPDCSLIYGTSDSNFKLVQQTPNYQSFLHDASGLTTTADLFSGGCVPTTTGITSQDGAVVGKLTNGNVAFASVSSNGVLVSIVTPLPTPTILSQTTYATLTASEVNAGAAVFGVAAADLTGDGIPDMVVATETNQNTGALTLNVLLGNGDGTFRTGQVITVPFAGAPVAGPLIGATIADVNGDGKPDLIAVTDATAVSGITVFLGQGNGTFSTPGIAGPVGAGGQTAVVADFNGDGHPDIATSFGQILLGNGDGTFALSAHTLPEKQAALTAGDFSHQGKISVAFSSANAFTIDVYSGNGDGTFTYAAAYPQIVGGYSIQNTDIDGDGYPDLFVGTAHGGGFTADISTSGLSQALLNRGDGTFGKSRAYFTGSRIYDVAAFTGSGHLDLLSVGRTDGTGAGALSTGTGAPVLWVLAGAGDGTFATQGIQSPLSGPVTPGDVLAIAGGDVNGDGKGDAVFAWGQAGSGETPTMSVALGNGDGTFQAQQNYPTPGGVAIISALTSSALLLLDVNGDGKPDILFIASPDGSVSAATAVYVMLNNGDGTYAAAQLIDSKPYLSYLAAADLNDDGKPDLVVNSAGNQGSSTPGAAYLYLGKGDGTFQPAVTLNPGLAYPAVIAIADMNADGKPDLIFAGSSSNSANEVVTVLLGNGNGTFRAAATSTTSNSDGATGIVVVDFNQDGKPDVVLGGSSSPYLLPGNGDGTFASTAAGNMTLATNSAHLKSANLTGLNLGDLLLSSGSALEVFVAARAVAGSTLTTTTLTATPNPAAAGQTLTLAAKVVSAAGGTPSGTVAFLDGTTQLGTAVLSAQGVATFTSTTLAAGTHALTAAYAGTATFAASTSAAVNLTVTAAQAGFSLSLAPASGSIAPGASVSTVLTLTPANGFIGTVTFACSGLPAGASCSFSPATVAVGGAPGSATLTIATASSASHVTPARAPVDPLAPARPLLASLAAPLLAWPRRRARSRVRPPAWTCALALAAILAGCGGGSDNSAGGATPAGSYTVTVTASSGATSRAASFALTVS